MKEGRVKQKWHTPFFWTEFNNGYCILTNLGEEEHIIMS